MHPPTPTPKPDPETKLETDTDTLLAMLMATNTNPEVHKLLPQFLRTKVAQTAAHITNNLLKTAHKRNLQVLRYQEKIIHRRQAFYTWFDDLKLVLASQSATTSVIQNRTEVKSFEDPKCGANKAVYDVVRAYVDNYFKRVISRCDEQGDAALKLIQAHCATVTEVDRNHYGKILSQITMLQGETISKYISRFLYARHNSEHVGNEHTDSYLIDIFLAGMAACKDPYYMTEKALLMTRRQQGDLFTFAEMESKFLALDETLARHHKKFDKSSLANAVLASSSDPKANTISLNPNMYSRDKRKSHKTKFGKTKTHKSSPSLPKFNMQNIKCYNCGKKGHMIKDCRSPRRPRRFVPNPTNNPRANALVQSNTNATPQVSNNVQHFTAHAQQTVARQHTANIAFLQANSATLSTDF